jgi:biopolymer transport protein ExbB
MQNREWMMMVLSKTNGMWKQLVIVIALGVVLTSGVTMAQGQQGTQAQPQQAAPGAQTATDGATAATSTPAPSADLSFFELLVKGGVFMIPIALASLLMLAIVFERWLALRRGRVMPKNFMNGLRRVARDREAALAYCQENDSPIARVIGAGIRRIGQGEERVERAMEEAGAKEIGKLRRNLRMLYGISVASPMMGLVGTVWGMIHAFRVTASGGGIGKPELLAKGIYEALVATLCGLAVAIPALILYYWFIGKIEKILENMNDVTQDFLDEYVEGGATTQRRAAAPAPRPAVTARANGD